MKHEGKKVFSWVLTLALILSCLTAIPAAAVAQADAPLLDGVKDDVYTDAQMLEISTAYAGSGQARTDNVNNIYTRSYYVWDDSYVYLWLDVFDPNSLCSYDLLYFANGVYEPGDFTFTFNAANGGGWEYNLATKTVEGQPGALEYVDATGKGAGTRSYEFRFPLAEDAKGFVYNPVAHVSGTHIISYGTNMFVTGYCKQVVLDDPSTFVDTSAIDPAVIVDGGSTSDPDPEPEPTPGTEPDGIKDDRYSDERMLEISTAYAGSGGGKIANTNHIFTRSYYAWDDQYVYVWLDVYDPDNVTAIDVFYFANGVFDATDRTFIFNKEGGGDVEITVATGATKESNPNSTLEWAVAKGAGTRCYEFRFERIADANGFTFGPVAWVNGGYSVSYGPNYYVTGDCKPIVFNDPSTFTDTSAVDPAVVNDPALLQEIQTAIEKLPADASSLTYADKALVEEVKAEIKKVPASWLTRLDAAIVERYYNAVERMIALEAEQQHEAIQAVEDTIAALPEVIGLEHKEAVMAAKTAYDALGDIKAHVDAALSAKLNAALLRLDTLSAPVKIDGKPDPAYNSFDSYDITMEFAVTNSSDVLGIDPAVTGKVCAIADEKYVYVYVEVFDDSVVLVPEGSVFGKPHEMRYDGIVTYVNMDPSNNPYGAPYQDDEAAGCQDFYFDVLADGTLPSIYIIEGKNDFLTDSNNFVSFTTDTGYGYEMRLPRTEGEETFSMNIVIVDPVYVTEEGSEEEVFSTEDSRMIALGGEWWANYLQWATWYYEDFPAYWNYLQVTEAINALPAADAITDKSLEKQVAEIRTAYDWLNEEQAALIPAEVVLHLTQVEAAIDAVDDEPPAPTVVYGDLNDDGKVDAKDALMILQAAVGKLNLTQPQMTAADVNGDADIDAKDALLVLRKAVDKIDTFPVEE